jgi:hypothetical protein
VKKDPEITEPTVNFPLILNCLQCGSRVRVARPGSFRCPSCKNVSKVDSNGDVGSEEEKSESVTTRKPTSTERRLRMESFLSEKVEEEPEEPETDVPSVAAIPNEPELSASEKLKLFREQEAVSAPVEQTESEESEPETEPENKKKTKKRKGPPKGGSFGPTVGGF